MNIDDLFIPDAITHKKLFPPDALPWYPLLQLKEYMQNLSYPSWKKLPVDGTPLSRTIVLYNGILYDGSSMEITFADATKGNLVVTQNGKRLVGASVLMGGAVFSGREILVGNGVLVESGAMIKAPTVLGDCCEVRQGAYLRGYCLIGNRCVVGHATEVKHTILLDDAKAGHFAYLGDSVLGADVNLGAGTKCANLRFLEGNICISLDGKKVDTALRKCGAILGDAVQTGCNSVTSPGTVMGKNAMLFPNTTAQAGVYAARVIIR